MILDRLENWRLYAAPGSRMERAFEYLLSFDPSTPDGRIEVEGSDLFALPQSIVTRSDEEGRFEAHRVYADIQLNIAGGECMGWAPIQGLDIEMPYDPERDLMFFQAPTRWTRLRVPPGSFTVFYPEDAHAPNLHLDAPGQARKVVMKVRLG